MRILLVGLLFLGLGFPPAGERNREEACPPGPRKTVAVGRLEARVGGVDARIVREMLLTALAETGCFLVLEEDGAAPWTLKGAITEFEETSRAAGIGGLRGNIFGGIAGKKARVAVDLRLVERRTGAVLEAANGVGTASAVGGVVGGIPVGKTRIAVGTFQKTPLGKATRKALKSALAKIVQKLYELPWEAMVAKVANERVYINQGRNAGLKRGLRLVVVRPMEEIRDPGSGALLGYEEARIGIVEIVEVREKFAVARVVRQEASIREGDLVRLAQAGG